MLFGKRSEFCRSLTPVGRILELEGYYDWCCAPVYDGAGKVHVLFSRWPEKQGFLNGWLTHSEIAHAVADSPESPFTVTGTVLKGRGPGRKVEDACVFKAGGRYPLGQAADRI